MNGVRILGLMALTVLSVVPMAKPAPPILNTQFLTQSVTLSSWSMNLVPIPGVACNGGTGQLVSYGGLNFTETLSGRDPGSTWMQFNAGAGTPAFLFKSSDLTISVINQLACSISPALTLAQFTLGTDTLSSFNWRVPASGNYTLFAECLCVSFNTGSLAFVTAKESWTVTTIN